MFYDSSFLQERTEIMRGKAFKWVKIVFIFAKKVFFFMSRNSKPFFNIVYFPNDITEAHYFTYRTQNVVSQMILDVFLGILVMTLLMQDGFTESISTQFFMWTEVHLKQ